MKLKHKSSEEKKTPKIIPYTDKIDYLVKKEILKITNNGKIYSFTIKKIRYNLNWSNIEKSKIMFLNKTIKNLLKLGIIERISTRGFNLINPKYLIDDIKKPR